MSVNNTSQGVETMTTHALAQALSIVCDDDTLARILDATLSADADDRLNDDQAEMAVGLFESICEIRPDCIELAQSLDDRDATIAVLIEREMKAGA